MHREIALLLLKLSFGFTLSVKIKLQMLVYGFILVWLNVCLVMEMNFKHQLMFNKLSYLRQHNSISSTQALCSHVALRLYFQRTPANNLLMDGWLSTIPDGTCCCHQRLIAGVNGWSVVAWQQRCAPPRCSGFMEIYRYLALLLAGASNPRPSDHPRRRYPQVHLTTTPPHAADAD